MSRSRFPDVNWGSSSSALLYIGSLKSLFKLQETEDHVKNFRWDITDAVGFTVFFFACADLSFWF